MSEPVTSLYVHVPFCARKCQYCAFYSEPINPLLADRYLAALIREMEMASTDLAPQTVYFGGGTPTLLTVTQWERLFQAMDRLRLRGAAEWTVECNPGTLTTRQAEYLRRQGMNRISLGLQSLDDQFLERLGRIHTRAIACAAYDRLRRAGFQNINIDLMFAIPGQTLDSWQQTLRAALEMDSEHLSCYEVTYEEDTPLFEQLQAGRFSVDENLASDMYEALVAQAGEAGFHQYEVSNFARHRPTNPPTESKLEFLAQSSERAPDVPSPSRIARPGKPVVKHRQDAAMLAPDEIPSLACRHNVNYWRGGAFYGLGPSATSYVRGRRSRNWADTARYCEQLECGIQPVESAEELPPLARAGEIAAFGLRLTAGWPFALFQQVTGFDLRSEWVGEMEKLLQLEYGQMDANGFRLTTRGLRFADWVAEQFLRP
jgi:oxygen-independent coproporphyrinogen III oxidase